MGSGLTERVTSRRVTPEPDLPIAVDAMGGDRAPVEIVRGAREAVDHHGVSIMLVGRPDEIAATGEAGDLPVMAASEVIAMDADPAQGVRRLKDSSLVRAAEAVRDSAACAMVSAGNTGATMGSALLRMGRIKGVARPAIATPIPCPGAATPTILLDAGANAECQPEWMVQFAQMGAVLARRRYGIDQPRVGLLSIGEEPGKGNPLVKATHALLSGHGVGGGRWADGAGARFVGNVEGRDLMSPDIDVVVTDGFTGNVALKTLEGGMRALVAAIMGAFDTDETTRAAADTLMPSLLPLYATLDPDATGGAMLLGVKGVCIIGHGSSSATAVVNAAKVAAEMVAADLVGELTSVVAP